MEGGGTEGGREVRKRTGESSDTCSDKHNLSRPFYLYSYTRIQGAHGPSYDFTRPRYKIECLYENTGVTFNIQLAPASQNDSTLPLNLPCGRVLVQLDRTLMEEDQREDTSGGSCFVTRGNII